MMKLLKLRHEFHMETTCPCMCPMVLPQMRHLESTQPANGMSIVFNFTAIYPHKCLES